MPATIVADASSSANSHSHQAVLSDVRITAIRNAAPGIAPMMEAAGNAHTRPHHFASQAG